MKNVSTSRLIFDPTLAVWANVEAAGRQIRRLVRLPADWKKGRLRLARMFPAKPTGFGAQYEFEVYGPSGNSVLGSLYLSPITQEISKHSSTITIRRRGTFPLTGISLPVAEGRLLLHTPDLDPHLPTLREAISPSLMRQRLKWRTPPRCSCLSYRPGRRCTLAYSEEGPGGNYVVGKIYSNGAVHSTPAMHRWVLGALGGASETPFEVPRVIRSLSDLRMVVFEGLAPVARPEEQLDRRQRAVAAGRILAALHSLGGPDDRRFSSRDELKAAARWCALANHLKRASLRRYRLWVWLNGAVRRITQGPAVLLHRDFYDAQLLATERGWALVDLDTAAGGDRELDMGNYIAHLMWNVVQSARTPSDTPDEVLLFMDSYRKFNGHGVKRIDAARLRFYLVSSLLRVATIHSLRSGEEAAARRLLSLAERWAACPARSCLSRLASRFGGST